MSDKPLGGRIQGILYRDFDKPERLRALAVVAHRLEPGAYWHLVGEMYRSTESAYDNLDVIEQLFMCPRPRRYLVMTNMESKRLRRLHKEPTIYRGCWAGNAAGWSWTLSRKTATWYANRCPYDGQPLIIKGRVRQTDILAYFGGEGHEELVIPPGRVRVVTRIELPPIEITAVQSMSQKVQAGVLDFNWDPQFLLQRVKWMVEANGVEHVVSECNARIKDLHEFGWTQRAKDYEGMRALALDVAEQAG